MDSPPTDRPTDSSQTVEPTVPTHYISIRLTVAHDEWPKVMSSVLHDTIDYIAYPHFGKDRSNPHYHIFIPSSDTRGGDKFRNRINKVFGKGNEVFSIAFKSNGILNAITYGSKEGTESITGSLSMLSLVEQAPAWEHKEMGIGAYLKKPKVSRLDPDHFSQLTYRNIEKATLRYRQRRGIKSDQLEDTLEAMFKDNWRFDRSLLDRGIPAAIFTEFTKQCHGESGWCKNRFLRMRVCENWNMS